MKIIKIGAVWCSGCLVMRPRWQKIEKDLPELKTEYFDFDERKDMVAKYNVEGEKLPVFIFLDENDIELDRRHGEVEVKDLLLLIEKYKNK